MNYRDDFPQLKTIMNGHPLIYADYASTALKPVSVIDTLTSYYQQHVANPGRGAHSLAFANEQAIAAVRNKILDFLQANPRDYTVIFTKSATESINIVARSIAKTMPSATVVFSEAEHHANFLPWIRLSEESGHHHSLAPLTSEGTIDIPALLSLRQTSEPTIAAITLCSNVTGNNTPLEQITASTQRENSYLLVDATQALPHFQIKLSETPVDFLVASAHKLFGPEGVGILVVNHRALHLLEPLLLGGGIVEKVTSKDYLLKSTVERFEAGTQNTAGIIGLGAAIDYVSAIGMQNIVAAEKILEQHMSTMLHELPEIRFLPRNTVSLHVPIFSFYHPTIHAHDIADYLNQQGIAVRAGYHCAEPLHHQLHVPPTVRISLSFLNTPQEVNQIFAILKECLQKYA